MDIDNLVMMANRIGQFFSVYPDRKEGEREVANHIRRFWEPRMRQALFRYVDEEGGIELEPIVLQAVRDHRLELAPQDVPS